jgi:hypothetical protein
MLEFSKMNRTYTIRLYVHPSSPLEPVDESYETFKEAICRLREIKDLLTYRRFNLLLNYSQDGILQNIIRYYGFDAPSHAAGGWLPVRGDYDFATSAAKALSRGETDPELYEHQPFAESNAI